MSVDQRIDTAVAGYRVERLLGRGGMGAVYLAEDERLGRKVALKLLAPDLSGDAGFRERFLRESRLAAGLEHPNVVPIHQAGEADGTLFIAMRYVPGTDVRRELAEQGPLEPARTVAIVAQVAAALDTAHSGGLVHRDVKPGNILLGPDDHVYLSDFGLTKQASSQSGLTATGQLVGTLDYVAPEQIQGGTVDGRADVYSLACVAYECLTGRPPFHKDTDVATLWAHIQDTAPPTGDPALDPVLARGLAKKPEERYTRAGELAADLRRALGVSSGEIPVPAGARRLDRRFIAAAALAALALVAAAVAIVASRGGSGSPALASLQPNSLGVLDASSGKILADIPLGGAAGRAAFGGGAAWVANTDDQTLLRIDPRTYAVEKTIGLGFRPAAVTATDGTVWVADPVRRAVVAYDAASATERVTIRVSVAKPGGYVDVGRPSMLDVGAGAVWADAGPTRVARIRERDGVVRTGDFDNLVSSIAYGEGGLWYADEASAAVVKVDPARVAPALTVPLGTAGATTQLPRAGALAVGAQAAWVVVFRAISCGGTDPCPDASKPATVYRIDLTTGGVNATVPVGRISVSRSAFESAAALAPIAAAAGSVWVGDQRHGALLRIDAAKREVADRIGLGAPPTAIAFHGGRLWVTVGK